MPNEAKQAEKTEAEPKVEHRRREMCPRCEQPGLKRLKRAGFRQKIVFPLLGYFPWHCGRCGGDFVLRKRGRRKHAAIVQAAAE